MKPARRTTWYAGALVAMVVLAGSVVLSLSVPMRSEHELWVLAASSVPWAILGYLVARVVLLAVRRGATWPSPGSRTFAGLSVPMRVMALDHVLLSKEFSAVSTSVQSVPGTDQDALVARLVLR